LNAGYNTDMNATLATGLKCLRCGRTSRFERHARSCAECPADGDDPAIQDVQYDYDEAAARIAAGTRKRGVFRYAPLLPVAEPSRSILRAGNTALVSAPRIASRLGIRELLLKDETSNPTRCLKDRATAIAVAMALEDGSGVLYCASAGNAAISLAGFCAHAGLQCKVFVPNGVSAERLAWLHRFGAEVRISTGNYDQAYLEAEQAGSAAGWHSRNCALNPFIVEGKKTAAHEIFEDLGEAPDMVVAPVGDGCTIGALGKGFRERVLMRESSRVPMLVGVQSDRIRPLVDRFNDGVSAAIQQTGKPPLAASIAVAKPRNGIRAISEVRSSGGRMLAVSDDEIIEAQKILATEAGMVAEHTSAATLAALIRISADTPLRDLRVVLVITGGRVDSTH
jgi:threonine synthase